MGKGSLKCDHSQGEHEPITGSFFGVLFPQLSLPAIAAFKATADQVALPNPVSRVMSCD